MMAPPCTDLMTWEYRILTIGVRRGGQSNTGPSTPGANKPAPAPAADPTPHPKPQGQGGGSGSASGSSRSSGSGEETLSQMYRDLEFPSKYLNPTSTAQKAPLSYGKQLEQVLNRLATEGWEYVGLDLLLGEQVVVMRRPRPSQPQPEPQTSPEAEAETKQPLPWWRRWRRR